MKKKTKILNAEEQTEYEKLLAGVETATDVTNILIQKFDEFAEAFDRRIERLENHMTAIAKNQALAKRENAKWRESFRGSTEQNLEQSEAARIKDTGKTKILRHKRT